MSNHIHIISCHIIIHTVSIIRDFHQTFQKFIFSCFPPRDRTTQNRDRVFTKAQSYTDVLRVSTRYILTRIICPESKGNMHNGFPFRVWLSVITTGLCTEVRVEEETKWSHDKNTSQINFVFNSRFSLREKPYKNKPNHLQAHTCRRAHSSCVPAVAMATAAKSKRTAFVLGSCWAETIPKCWYYYLTNPYSSRQYALCLPIIIYIVI